MPPNATFTGKHRAHALLDGSVDTGDTAPAPAPSCGRHPASFSFSEAYTMECYQPQGLVMRPTWDRPGFRKNKSCSRAIPIESKTDEDDLEEIPENGGHSIYNKATWRMYNRITYHRQKYPVNATMIPHQATDLTNSQSYCLSDNVNLLPHNVVYPTLVQCSDCYLDDEIFEFEL